MHLRQPALLDKSAFTYSTCGLFTKNKERIRRFKKTGDTRYIYQNELHKACFQLDLAYEDFKDITRRTAADIILRDKALNIAKDSRYDGYQRGFASMVYNFFDKKTKGSGLSYTINSMSPNKQLAEELHKPVIRKFKKRRVYASYRDAIWASNLAEMELISKFNKGFRFLLCVIENRSLQRDLLGH